MNKDLSEDALNEFVESGCHGFLVADATMIAGYLIELLRSDFEISAGARRALADALDRGRGNSREVELNGEGQEMPRIVVEGVGWNGAYARRLAVRRNWMAAADAFWERCEAGAPANDELRLQIGASHDLQLEAMRKALAFHKRFWVEYETPGNSLKAEAEVFLSPHAPGPEDPDLLGFCRSLFLEREARKGMPPPPAC